MLNAKNRVQLPADLQAWFTRATAYSREAPLTHEIAFIAHCLPLPHKDPADRFLAATAKLLGLILVTQDPDLLGLGDIQTLLEDRQTTIQTLRQLLLKPSTEKTEKVLQKLELESSEKKNQAPDGKGPESTAKGHGRNGADRYQAAQKIAIARPQIACWIE